MTILMITLIGTLAGVLGTGIGAVLALAFRKPSCTLMSSVLGFAGGIMISVVTFDLIPEAIETGGIYYGIMGVIIGTILMALLDTVVPHVNYSCKDGELGRYIRTGMLLAIGIALHNLPEGLAIGSGYAHSSELGFSLALIIAIQNTPEGIAMAAPMVMGKMDFRKILLVAFMAGIPMGIGAFLGSYIGNISDAFLSLSLGFAGGAMLYISFDELIPQAQKLSQGHSAVFGGVIGVISGILLHYIL